MYGTDVTHCLDDIACSGFPFSTDERGTFRNPAECLAQVATPTDEGDFKVMFGDVVNFIGWSQYFAFINVIDSNCFEDLIHQHVAEGPQT